MRRRRAILGVLSLIGSGAALTMSVRHTVPSDLANLAYLACMVVLGPISILHFAIRDPPHWEVFVLPGATGVLLVAGLFGPRSFATGALTITWLLWLFSQWVVARAATL